MNSNSLNWALKQTARSLSLPPALVERVYKSYWSFIREQIESVTVKDITEEEARQTTSNFNIPYIGKIYLDYSKIEKYHNQLNFYQNVRSKENQANRQSGSSD